MVNWWYKWYIQIGGTNWPIKWPVQRHPCETDGTFWSGGGFKSVGGFLTQGFPLPFPLSKRYQAFDFAPNIRHHQRLIRTEDHRALYDAPRHATWISLWHPSTPHRMRPGSGQSGGCCLIEAVPVRLFVRFACLLGPHPQFTVNTLLKEFESRHPNSFIFQHSSTFLLASLLFKASCNVKTVSARPARIRWANSTTSTGDHASVEPTVN